LARACFDKTRGLTLIAGTGIFSISLIQDRATSGAWKRKEITRLFTFHPTMPPRIEEEEEDYPGDTNTIVNPWSRPSSPESMSACTNHQNIPRDLESPEPLDDDISTPNPAAERSIPEFDHSASRQARPRQRLNNTTMEERLMMMPEKRPLPWRDGVEPGADNETGGESRRKQIRFGCLLATRGEIQEVPCNSCANGRAKFKVCVALEGYFKGACASCQLSGRPNRCSIKKNDGKFLYCR